MRARESRERRERCALPPGTPPTAPDPAGAQGVPLNGDDEDDPRFLVAFLCGALVGALSAGVGIAIFAVAAGIQ